MQNFAGPNTAPACTHFGPIVIKKCDSPIEDVFIWEFNKVADLNIRLSPQVDCATNLGMFRLDFVIRTTNGLNSIGIECDGRDFHDAERDAERDAAIIQTSLVSRIYRIRGKDINNRMYDAFQLLSMNEPWLFSERGIHMVERLAELAHLREDSREERLSHFPYALVRYYKERNNPDGGIYRPPSTIIYWSGEF
jgi:hypothetical protein